MVVELCEELACLVLVELAEREVGHYLCVGFLWDEFIKIGLGVLVGFKKGLVLNKTNNGNLIKFLGKETENWGDKEVELYVVRVPFKNEDVDAIRVRQPETPTTTSAPPEPKIVPG